MHEELNLSDWYFGEEVDDTFYKLKQQIIKVFCEGEVTHGKPEFYVRYGYCSPDENGISTEDSFTPSEKLYVSYTLFEIDSGNAYSVHSPLEDMISICDEPKKVVRTLRDMADKIEKNSCEPEDPINYNLIPKW